VGTGGRCDGPNANAANVRSIFRYAGAGSGDPNSTAAAPLPTGCYDEQNVVPYAKTQVPQDTPDALELTFTDTAGSGNLVQWHINGSAMLVDLAYPTLQAVFDGNDEFSANKHVLEVGEKHKVRHPTYALRMPCSIYNRANAVSSGNTG
jgi:hypothetical protein